MSEQFIVRSSAPRNILRCAPLRSPPDSPDSGAEHSAARRSVSALQSSPVQSGPVLRSECEFDEDMN